ncbi:hypothetical protein [Nocardioides sp. Leaf307]|uniref:hypothetical protein n=1 Tax=Nocardioides sp. Leaf307 TaxID=1736331 RepID=UPI0007033BCF|nr:hypothetical protein [Nocardioides sp. Leaf307]KQQ42701.1 hypothetical protein ASF50_01225 [Nocardioides sp. Leaf307]
MQDPDMWESDRRQGWFEPSAAPRHPLPGGVGEHRLTHLVLVDGRLVDAWSEPVEHTDWEHVARRHDQERRPLPPPPPPPPPAHEQVQAWLERVCGGREALEALDDLPLDDDGTDLPDTLEDLPLRRRAEGVGELLDAVAAAHLDVESSYALRRALVALSVLEPEVVTGARSAAHLAGGLCWAVGRANGWFHPHGSLRLTMVQDALALPGSPAAVGGLVRRALVGLRWGDLEGRERPREAPDLLPLGRPDLLTAATRVRLTRLRERAREAREAA